MFHAKNKSYVFGSVLLLLSVLVVGMLGKEPTQPTPIHGSSSYSIIMNSANAPTTSTEYGDVEAKVRNTDFYYYKVKNYSGGHTELGAYGEIYNQDASRITSITGVTAVFTSSGTFTLITTYDRENYFEYPLTSGVTQSTPYLPYFLVLRAGDQSVAIESITITYTCSAHSETLDKYTVTWYDSDATTVLEVDTDVEPGSMPSYDGPTPFKDYDAATKSYFSFSGWRTPLVAVTGNQSYCATYKPYKAEYTLLSGGASYELTSLVDNTITSYDIPSIVQGLPVTSIGYFALGGYPNLTSVTIPSSVTHISEYAFYGSKLLTSISISAFVNYIGPYAFGECSGLTAINVSPDNALYSSQDGVLFDKPGTSIMCYPAGKGVGSTYTIPDGVIGIGDNAFFYALIAGVEIPSSVVEIGINAFGGCSSLSSVIVPDSVTNIGFSAFANCTSLTYLMLPSAMTYLPASLCYACTSLVSFYVPASVTLIESDAFGDCISLMNVYFPTTLEYLGERVFSGCFALTDVVLPEGVLGIESQTFYNCTSLRTVMLPSTLNYIGYQVFAYCPNLYDIYIDPTNTAYQTINGVLFNFDASVLLFYPSGKADAEYTIPASVTTINSLSFLLPTNLASVIIPSTVTTVYTTAFTMTSGTINCEAASQPAGWQEYWNNYDTPVVWGYTF